MEGTISHMQRGPAVQGVLALAMLLAALGTSIANVALPALARDLAAPYAQVQGVVTAYLAALTLSVVVAGRLGDRLGLKRVLAAGLALFAAGALACALAPGFWALVAARAVQGMGAAVMMVLAMALMRQSAGAGAMGRAMGLLGTVSALGTALGPVLGGALLPLAGWRGLFWLQLPLGLLALVLALAVLPQGRAAGAARIPGLRAALDRDLLPGLAVNLLVAAVMMATLTVGPFYLTGALGLTAPQAGLVMAVGPVVSILSGLPAGRLVDRLGSGRVLRLGLGLLAAGAAGLALLPGFAGVAGYGLALAVLTPGYQLFQAANNTQALAERPEGLRGTVSGLLALSRNLGLIAGASGLGAVFVLGAGSGDLAQAGPEALTHGLRLTFLTGAALALVALGLTRRWGFATSVPCPKP
jgi:MFS family permease